ncbi:MAG: RsiV family protein [Clostridia bacterium]|nr:RsiV family protein [Clostridia bacterium]
MKKTIVLLLCAMCAGVIGAALAEDIGILQAEKHATYEVGGTTLAALHATLPQLAKADAEEAMARVNAAIRTYVLTEGGYDDACEYALADYLYAPEKFAQTDYGLKAAVQAEILDGGALLAVRYDFVFYAGGPHPWDTVAAQHFDLSTGMPVTLEALAPDPAALRERVEEETLRWIEGSGFEAFGDARELVGEWPLKNALLTGEGLLVFYNEGEIGPVSAGAAEILIPYDRLTGLLR